MTLLLLVSALAFARPENNNYSGWVKLKRSLVA